MRLRLAALADHLRAKGYLPDESTDAPQSAVAADRYADADPNEAVMVTGVGPMILHRAVRKRVDWREHHELNLVSVFRGADKQPSVFDMVDLGRLPSWSGFGEWPCHPRLYGPSPRQGVFGIHR